MGKPNVIQVTAGLTIAMSVGANVWYGIDSMERGGFQLIVVGVWMPIILALLERVLHASRAGKFFKLMLALVAVCAMAYSMSHLAHLATPAGANLWEHVSAWLFAVTVDVAMVLAGWALMSRSEPQVTERIVERIVEVQVPVEIVKEVYIEVPAKREALHVEASIEEVEETETITETRREVTRTARRSSLTAEQEQQIYELGMAGVKPADILRKLAIEGKQTNYITRSAVWARVKAEAAQITA